MKKQKLKNVGAVERERERESSINRRGCDKHFICDICERWIK